VGGPESFAGTALVAEPVSPRFGVAEEDASGVESTEGEDAQDPSVTGSRRIQRNRSLIPLQYVEISCRSRSEACNLCHVSE
jgi:hypothetical protein